MKSLVLCLALLIGCQSWNVNAFGYRVPASGSATYGTPVDYGHHLQASDKYQTKSTSGSGSMTTEEKWGVVLILGVAIGAGIAVAAAAN